MNLIRFHLIATTNAAATTLNLHRRVKLTFKSRPSFTSSLQADTLKTLEWPLICRQLSKFTSTSMGRAVAESANIPLGRTPDESLKLLAQTSAAVAFPWPLDFSGIEDISPIIDSSTSGMSLSIRELCAIKRTLESARTLVEELEQVSLDHNLSERCSPLLEILQNCNFLRELGQMIDFCLDCKFSVILDRASEELEIIRLERKTNMENLESLLKQVSNQIFQAGGIDRPLVTKRRSRMCVAIRASYKSLLPEGIVLDASSSGATYFMEPKEAVELNNMEVRLSNSEKIEEQAILSLLTSAVAESRSEIEYLLDRILEMDLAFARAAHARWINGVCPILNSETGETSGSSSLLIDIEGMQHPLLLESSLSKFPADINSGSNLSTDHENGNMNSERISGPCNFPVPVDIKIKNGVRVVVISGPNTGGKTASMKTLGVASLMLKGGLYLPARKQPQLPWFDLVLADIGDHQSLEQSLSTFSGHILRLREILEMASKKSLVLIDEIGCGTDPSEGVALSASILQYLKDKVNLAVVTTHFADLTRLSEKDTRFENAAMEFSLETLKPTYKILWGSIGQSNALSIAKLIGFDPKIIERAQTWVKNLTPENMQKRKGLLYQSLIEERKNLVTQAKRAGVLHSDIMNLFREIRDEADDLDAREATLKAKETQIIQQELKAVQTEMEDVVQEFEKQLRDASPDQINLLLKEAESAIASIVEDHQPKDSFTYGGSGGNSYMPRLGEQVHVKGLGNKLATIIELPGEDDSVLVQYGKIRVRVNRSSIKALVKGDPHDAETSASSRKRQAQGIKTLRSLKSLSNSSKSEEVSYGLVLPTSRNTLDLRGMRVEEATHHLKMAIDAISQNSVLFIVHGMGTGVVKESTLKLLQNHPRVSKFEQESPMNYGCTVAYIK